MKRKIAAVLAMLPLLMLGGCSNVGGESGTDEVNPTGVAARTVHTDDGRIIQCVFFYQDSLSCDWSDSR
jgi:major membrane immunogen (membrane-anchored lipoprotein)